MGCGNVIFTAQDIARNFDARDNSRGKAYQAESRVKDISVQNDGRFIEALVHGTDRYPYRVSIEVKKIGPRVRMEAECSCPVGYMCKHAAAALYEALAEENRQQERLRRPSAKPAAGKLSPRLTNWIAKLEETGKDAKTNDDDRVVYFLSQQKQGAMPHIAVMPALQHRMKDGAWSKPRPQSFRHLADLDRYNAIFDAEDEAVVSLVFADTGPSSHAPSWQPPNDPELIDLFLRRVVKTGRVFIEDNPIHPLHLGAAIEASPDWALLSDGRQIPNLIGARPGLIFLLSRSPWYVDPLTGEAGPLLCGLGPEKLLLFLSGGAIEEKDAALLRQRMEKTQAAPVPSPYRVKTAKEPGVAPVAHLSLVKSGEDEANVFLLFDYEGCAIHPASSSPHYQKKSGNEILLLRRDKAEEKRLLALAAQHALIARDAEDPRGLVFDRPENASPWFWLDFQHIAAPELRQAGIAVQIDAAFKTEIVEPDNEDIDAAFTQNGEWWFSLDLGISVGGQRVKLLPLLVAMIRKLRSLEDVDKLTQAETCFVPLPDGRQIALPSARIQTILKTLVELFDDKALDKDGQIRVSMDLAAAFLKLESITRKRWLGEGHLRKLVEKLGDFEGIKQVAKPKGLKADLRPYQTDGYNWLHFLGHYGLSGILADDMGLGKTVQALAYIQSLKERDALDGPCLIVMPTSLIANWQAETARFTPEMKTLTLHGKERLKRYSDASRADIVFTTYPLLPRDGETLAKVKWSIVILDEAQAIKNPAAKMTQAACALQAKQRLCLTGTPVENHLGEAWSLFTFLMPGLLGDHRSFAKHYRTPIEKGGDDERRLLLARRLKPFVLRRLKTEVAKELPPKTEMIRRVTLADDQRDLYEAVRHVMSEKVQEEIAAKGIARSQIVILDALLKLRQTCCDPRLVKLEAARKVKNSAKLEELMEMLPTLIEEGRRILLFSQFTSMLDLIKPEVEKAGIPFVELRGTTKDRATPVKRFQKGEVPLFLISLKAGGTGLNLTAADTVIHYDPWWNPSVENQATDRAHRIGQDKPVFVYKMIAEGTVEERILELQGKKAGLAAALFGDKPGAASKLTPEDLQWLMG